ncbi:aldehyde dehydrogenase family protein [Edaphobacter sp.]|uniref:aldehyde dehydrogenase family protein n=1 Tax=Edaphobacter sp. TaxID=1934404 RepID=UPI002DBE5586|nr:aldehyde dehydrogenase family protein [Edaphobacter sp.]HEU5339719.1 aldehyde dehydrogenase family protein [Edaphobacter sp.]
MGNSVVEQFYAMDYGVAPEDPKETNRWLDMHERRFGHYIDGQWHKPASGEYFVTSNPASDDKIADVAQADVADVDAAVAAARKALPVWQALSGHERARYLYALARQVQKHSRRLAVLETMDNGKPIRESRDLDIPLVARHFYHHAGWAQLLDREFPGYAACGVVGQIIPWNFPLLMFAWKVAPALAAGNTVIIKPAEYTPLTALAMAELAMEIGLPPGVLNVINGDGRVGALITAHDGIDKIAFTGSTEVGRIIRKATASSTKKLSLELGGKSPFIVFDDADLDSAVEGLVDGIWLNQGQVCCAGSRLLVQERIAETLYEKIRARMKTLRVGSPLDKSIDIGAIVAPVQLERIRSLVDQGVAEGANCWQPEMTMPGKGLFYPPTLLTGVHPTAMVAQEEIFGPVLASMTFRTPSEAVELANNTTYGLAASIWSESINVALDVASQVKAGVVWVNSTNLFDASCGFGGYRESGYGREGGREGMYEYLEPTWLHRSPQKKRAVTVSSGINGQAASVSMSIDRTVKQYIGGKQARPDSGYSFPVHSHDGRLIGEAPLGNRKDIRNAVEAAHKAEKWAKTPAHTRAQVLYYLAENMAQRRAEITARLMQFVGEELAAREVAYSIERIFTYAAWADKYDGAVHNPPMRNVTLAMNEAIGVVGIICPEEAPMLSFLSLVLPAVAAGNTVVAVPSEKYATIMGDLYQIFDTSDLPGGVVNIVAGRPEELAKTLAEHDDVDAIWCFRNAADATMVKAASIGNLKQVWTNDKYDIDWFDPAQAEGRYFMQHATQIKNIWVPYGE